MKRIFIYLKDINLNVTQKILLLLSLINIVLLPVYGSMWLGQNKTGGWSNQNPSDDEMFLCIGVTLVLIVGVIMFKSKK
jgi:hypothetical protein